MVLKSGNSGKMSTGSPSSTSEDDRPSKPARVSKTVRLDVVELLKQVLQWTPLYKPGLNRALLQAAKVGSLGCVKVLLSAGAECDTEDENGDTPFVHAFQGQHLEVMEALRESGCQTEIAKMSLALATKDGQFVKVCHRMDIPVENEDWNTGDSTEVSILLEVLHLDPFEGQYGRHGFEDSPFMYISQEGKPEILELLLQKHPCLAKYGIEDKQEKLNRAFHKAIRHHRFDNARLLLEKLGAELEAEDSQGRTAFLLACGRDERIAHMLMEAGANLNVLDREGLSPLHWAACSGFKSLCRALLGAGVHVDMRAKLGATPLMVACSSRHADIAELFLNKGSNVNITTPEGWTALHVAVRACAPSIVRLLLSRGANPDVQSSRLTHNSDIVPASTPLLIAIALNSMRMIRHLLDANCEINMAGLVCANPNFSSSESEDDSKLQKQRCTPIQYAVMSRAWDIAELLLRAGCSVTSIRIWLDFNRAPVHIPEDKVRHFKKLVQQAITVPAKLKYLARKKVRQLLGRHLLTKVDKMKHLPPACKHFIMYHDLFRLTEGSFEV